MYMLPLVLCFIPQVSISLYSEEMRLCWFLYNRRLPWLPTTSNSNILLLSPMDHTIVLFGSVSAFTTSKKEDYRLDPFHEWLLRTMPCSHLNPVWGQHLTFPNKRNQLKTKFPAQSPSLCLLHGQDLEKKPSSVILTLELQWIAELSGFSSLIWEVSC